MMSVKTLLVRCVKRRSKINATIILDTQWNQNRRESLRTTYEDYTDT